MTVRRRSRIPVRTTQRRKLVWATVDQSVTIIAGAKTNVNLLAALSVAGSSLLGVTIMRTHVEIAPTTALTLGDGLRVGFLVARVADVGAGVTGSPDPSDPELDWMLWRHEHVTPLGIAPGGGDVLVYDIKAKRKMQELNQAYILSLLNSAGGSKTLYIQGRILLALP